MLTSGELAAMSNALAGAEAAVREAEAAAAEAANLLSRLPLVGGAFADHATEQAAEYARVSRGLLAALETKRDELTEAPDYDHEASAEVVAIARKLAGRDAAADVQAYVAASPLKVAGKSLADTVDMVTGAGPAGRWNPFQALARWAPWVVGLVLIVVVLPPLLSLFGVLAAPRSRR